MSATKTKTSAGGLRSSKGVGTGQASNGVEDTPLGAEVLGCRACPRYDRCSAPICPLDPDWRLRSHIENESVCGLLLELSKKDGEATLRACLPGEVAQAVTTLAAPILIAHGPVRRACEKAAKTGSRLKNWHARLAPAKQAG